jgi:hypothetical protein
MAFSDRRGETSDATQERRDSGQTDLLRSRLDQIVNMDHALVKLAQAVDWRFLEERLGEVYDAGDPQVDAQFVRQRPVRAVAGEPLLPCALSRRCV